MMQGAGMAWCAGAALAALAAAPAQADTVRSARTLPSGIALRTDGGLLTVEPWSEHIVHVRFGPAGFSGNYNPAVIATAEPVRFTVRETKDAWIVATRALRVTIGKATAAVAFADARGKPLLQEAERTLGASGPVQAFATATPIYGLGQHQQGLLDYSGTTVHLQQKNGEVGVPMMLSPRGFGILWNNASITDVDVAKPGAPAPLVVRNAAGGGIDYHFILGPSADAVIGGYRRLTGDAPLMARWTWGFWQSREHYKTQDETIGIARRYRQMGVPLDAVVIDWQHWQPGEWGAHRFDPARWPDPVGMTAAMHAMNVHVPISVWARFDRGTANAAELDRAGGLLPGTYRNVYPVGEGRWYDAWNPKARGIYWDQIRRSYAAQGFDAWWLDASELELSGKWGELSALPTAAGPGAVVYNSFPLLHTGAVHDGMRRDFPDRRVTILTRSAYAGQQRNGAITWSGDIHGDFPTLKKQIPAALNFAMSGIPYWSADIGGFFGGDPNDARYAELFTRWHQFAVFTPQFRVHGTGAGKEIWNFPAPVQQRLIADVALRYRLLPYIYATAWDVTHNRGTMMRAFVFDFPHDAQALQRTDEYMFGRALLVAPVVEAGATTRQVYLPAGSDWYDFRTGAHAAGGTTLEAKADIASIPVFARGGSIVPLGPVKPYADAPSDAPIELRVYPGRDGSFTLYDDAGDGHGYKKGERSLIPLAWDDRRHALTIGARDGAFPGMRARIDFAIVCGATPADRRSVGYAGRAVTVALKGCMAR